MGYRHLFGPVPSRRLGSSLGVDLVPGRTCSLDCVYCECGRTKVMTVSRDEYASYSGVAGELKRYLSVSPEPDFITLSGSGEPTLNSRMGDVVSFLKDEWDIPVAVLTNGTLLSSPRVRAELARADLVLPSLDAATETAFRRINRPHRSLSAGDHVKGLLDFRRGFKGDIWMEVFILPGFNDDRENLDAMREVLFRMKPEKIQLNTLDRPGTLEWLVPVERGFLENLVREWELPGLEIIPSASVRRRGRSFQEEIEQTILQTIRRRPSTLADLCGVLGLHENEVNKYLSALENSGLIETVTLERGVFFRSRA